MNGLTRMTRSCGGELAFGDPVAYRRTGVEILGRIYGFGGIPYDGVYPHVYLITPQGEVAEFGRGWIHSLHGADLQRLRNIEGQVEVPYSDPRTGEPLWPL